jgi:Bacterial inner membrane protein
MPEWLGWGATAVFVGSYGFRGATATRIVQAFGACLWIVYGVLLGARPVILANALVVCAALLSLWRARRTELAGDKTVVSAR